MKELTVQKRLRIYFTDLDKYEGISLHEWLSYEAKKLRLDQVVTFSGYDHHGEQRAYLAMDNALPVILEVIDTQENIEEFWQIIESALVDYVITLEEVSVFKSNNDLDAEQEN